MQDHDVAPIDQAHEPVFFIDTARPSSGQCVLELFRLADALEGAAHDVINQAIDPFQRRTIGLYPEIFLISDLVGYWVYRTFHGRRLWRFHSIHHSIEEVDWLAAARVHPVDTIVNRVMQTVPIFMLGFSSVHVLPLYALVIAVYPIFLHANVGWSYGPLKYAIASPAFHRWHHTAEAEGINKNYAALFPFLDIVFGTWYQPPRPSTCYGLGGDQHMSLSPLKQLIHPFNLRAITTRPAPEGRT